MTTNPVVFADCETTSLRPDRRAWEIALIRRVDDEREELLLQVEDIDLSEADPMALKIGGFYERHLGFAGKRIYPDITFAPEQDCADLVEDWTRGAHIVGVGVSFDTFTFEAMLRRHRLIPSWHYHVLDVSALALGYLNGERVTAGQPPVRPPYKSDQLAADLGVTPPADDERHTALGDARWAERIYDAVTGRFE